MKRLILADDHPLILTGLKTLLAQNFDLVGEAVNGRALVEQVERLQPDFIVLDIAMPELNGIEAARQSKKCAPKAKVVFVTQQMDRQYVVAAFRAGACGYVLKQSFLGELINALNEIQRGHFYVSPQLGVQVNSALFDPRQNPACLFQEKLTKRQREVLQLVAEGKAIKEIASLMDISPKTVNFHKASIMDELGLRTTARTHPLCA